jgi:hypothetical protein
MSRTIIGSAIVALLCSPSSALASLFTVGPNGTYSTLQEAIDAAADSPGEHLIKVRSGTFIESFGRHYDLVADRIVISGGWSVLFISRNPSPDATSFIANYGDRVATFDMSQGEIVMDGITFTGGAPTGSETGGGVKITLYYDASFVMRNCRIINNQVDGLLPYGGGLHLHASGTSHAEISNCAVSANSVSSSGAASTAVGAGVYMTASEQASVLMTWLEVEYNEGWSFSTAVTDGGLRIWADQAATVTLEDSVIANNSINGSGSASVAGVTITASVLSQVAVRRVAILDTSNSTPYMPDHVRVTARDSAVVSLSDSVIGPSTYTYYALQVDSDALATVSSTNLTITGNQGFAYRGVASGPNQSVFNSIIFGNGSDSLVNDPAVVTGANLVATDPLFADPANRNYQIRSGSPAINIGNNSPPGGLSVLDLNHMERVRGTTVDIGANEWGNLFADGFELGNTSRW